MLLIENIKGGIFAFGEYILALRLTSELVDLRAGYANSHSALRAEASTRPSRYRQKERASSRDALSFWSKWRDSNSRPPVPETGALPAALHLEILNC